MDIGLLRELGFLDKESLQAIEFAQQCVYFYEITLKAMGFSPSYTITQAIDSSKISYDNPVNTGINYGNIPRYY